MHLVLLASLLAPIIQVRGHSEITVVDAMVDGDHAILRGELRDRNLHTALSGRTVHVEVGGQESWRGVARTDAGGLFFVRFPLQDDARVRLRFAGDDFYLASRLGPIPLDARLPPVTLELEGPSQMRLADTAVELSLAARISGAPVAVDVTLYGDDGRVLGTARTGRDVVRVAVPTRRLGPPGPVRIVATSERGGRAVLEAMLRAPVLVTIRARPETAVVGDPITVEGIVRDPTGPLARASVKVRVRGQPLALVSTDDDGRYGTTIDSGGIGEGSVELEAVHSPRVPWREVGRSAPLVVRLSAPRPLPVSAVLVPVGLVVAGLLSHTLRARLRKKRTPALTTPAPGMRRAVPSTIRPALLRRPQRSVEGVVWDPFHSRPVGGARIELRGSDAGLATSADGRGRFALGPLRNGRHKASASAPGHVTLAFSVEIPHRGELSGFRIDLEPVRARALRMWCERARPFAEPERLLLATPAELAADQEALVPAARAFERIFYSGELPDESALDGIR